jgi:phage tail-like protein
MRLSTCKRCAAIVPVVVVLVSAMALAGRPAVAATQETLTAERISLSIDDREIASFTKLVELKTAVEPVTASGPNSVTLSRTLSSNKEMSDWQELVLQTGSAGFRNCSLVMYDSVGKPVARYHLENAWPSKIEIGSLKAGSSEVLLESVTIVVEHIQRVSV